MVTVFEQSFHLEHNDSYTCNIHRYSICHSQGTAFETLLALNYNSFILTVAIIGVGIYSIEAGGYNVFDSHARDIYHNSHSEGTCIFLKIPSMHKLLIKRIEYCYIWLAILLRTVILPQKVVGCP